MSLLDRIFGSAPQVQQPAQPSPTNNPNQNPPPAAPASSAVTAPNGAVPADGNKPGDQSPPDKFAGLWEPTKTEDPKPGEQTQGLTPEKMLEAAGKVDFTKALNPELLSKLQAGGQEAVQATLEMMNQTAKTVYGQSLVVSQKLVERAVEQAEERFRSQLPDFVRGQSARENLLSENPAFKDPKVAPIVAAVQQQILQKNPTASAAEVSRLAQEYFKEAAGVFSSDPKAAAAKIASDKKLAADDWESWIQTGISS